MDLQYLQKILSNKSCEASGEFEQSAEILQELLEKSENAAEACVPKSQQETNPAEASASSSAADAPQPAAPVVGPAPALTPVQNPAQ